VLFRSEATDLLEISEYDGVSAYVTKSITGQEVIDGIKNVLFYANAGAFPITGDVDFLYVAKNTGNVFIWDGAAYATADTPATSENIATNDLVFTANSTTDFDGYKATFDNAELKIVSDANTVSDIPFEITQTNGTDSIMKVTGDTNITVTSELFNQICPTDTARLKISGTGRTNLDFAVGGTNRGNIYSDGGQINISHNVGFIQYTCRDGLTADGNLDTNRVTFAYDNVTNDFKIKFKKDDGTVITKTIS
jgi:hypothetical protein